MSYTTNIKNEILNNEYNNTEQISELSAIININGEIENNSISLYTENIGVSRRIYKLLKEYHFYYINDIILNYIEIFSLDKEEVEQKIKELKEKFGNNYVYLIGDDMRALDYILI